MTAAQQVVWHHEGQDHGTRSARRLWPSKDPFFPDEFNRQARPIREAAAQADSMEPELIGYPISWIKPELRGDAELNSLVMTELYKDDTEFCGSDSESDEDDLADWEVELSNSNVVSITSNFGTTNAKTRKRRRKQAERHARKLTESIKAAAKVSAAAAHAAAKAQRTAAEQAELRRLIADQYGDWLNEFLYEELDSDFDPASCYPTFVDAGLPRDFGLHTGKGCSAPSDDVPEDDFSETDWFFHSCRIEAATGCII